MDPHIGISTGLYTTATSTYSHHLSKSTFPTTAGRGLMEQNTGGEQFSHIVGPGQFLLILGVFGLTVEGAAFGP